MALFRKYVLDIDFYLTTVLTPHIYFTHESLQLSLFNIGPDL